MNGVNSDLIRQIRNRAAELQKKSIAVVVDEGFHRSSTNDDYFKVVPMPYASWQVTLSNKTRLVR